MIKLERKKDCKWIFQKNVSSKNIITAYIDTIKEIKNVDAKESIQQRLKAKEAYKGRSDTGSLNTLGVRLSQMCFYMFGYKSNNIFVPSKMTDNILYDDTQLGKNMLVNLFSIQYPHPYSNTHPDFVLFVGRLIVKLLTDNRINERLYIDEFIWFLPFIKQINESIYEELIQSILDFRKLSYDEKLSLFESVDNYIDIFSNCMHECKYYFMKIFEDFNVFSMVEDLKHNDGKLLSFKHGNTDTYRRDNITNNHSGYVKIKENLREDAIKLINKFSPFDKPTQLSDDDIYSKEEWINKLYDIEPLKYLAEIMPSFNRQSELSSVLSEMTNAALYGSVDGKDFEKSLKPVFELFDKVIHVEIISGAGDTDLLCAAENDNLSIFKLNVDGKCRTSSNNVNIQRLKRHMKIHSSKYCIVVAPRFPRGTIQDMEGESVVALRADVLAKYCSKECLSNDSGQADFLAMNKIIMNNLGTDISPLVNQLINQKHGITLNVE